MFRINESYLKLPGNYLSSVVAKKVAACEKASPDRQVTRLGIGDAAPPIAPAIVEAIHKTADEVGRAKAFHGYALDLGYAFLRETIVKKDYRSQGCHVETDGIFVSDGTRGDCDNTQEIFNEDSRVAVCNPVYLVYMDLNVMAGRTGNYDPAIGVWNNVICMSCTAWDHFVSTLPEETPDLTHLCAPDNPAGTTLTRDQLKVWVDYTNRIGAVILYDAACETYAPEEDVSYSIFETQGARACAVEFRSFSKKAGFTGVHLGFTVVPKNLKCGDVTLHSLWIRCHGTRFNKTPYIEQRVGEAAYSEESSRQVAGQMTYYKRNARVIYDGLKEADYVVLGGVNSLYIWPKVEDGMDSWEFLGYLLEQANMVGIPGGGFRPSGQEYFRLTTFDTYENAAEAVRRIKAFRQ